MPKIKQKHLNEIGKVIEKLNKIINEIREYEPKANYWFDDGDLNLSLESLSETNWNNWVTSLEHTWVINHSDSGGA